MSDTGTRKAMRMVDENRGNMDIRDKLKPMNIDPAFETAIDGAMATVAEQPKTFKQRVADVVTQARMVRDVAKKMLDAAEAQVAAAEATARELEW